MLSFVLKNPLPIECLGQEVDPRNNITLVGEVFDEHMQFAIEGEQPEEAQSEQDHTYERPKLLLFYLLNHHLFCLAFLFGLRTHFNNIQILFQR